MIAYAIVAAALLVGMIRLESLADSTHDAFCDFKRDLERRAGTTEVYINDVKNGRREIIQGFTISELARSLANQRATLDSLSDLNC